MDRTNSLSRRKRTRRIRIVAVVSTFVIAGLVATSALSSPSSAHGGKHDDGATAEQAGTDVVSPFDVVRVPPGGRFASEQAWREFWVAFAAVLQQWLQSLPPTQTPVIEVASDAATTSAPPVTVARSVVAPEPSTSLTTPETQPPATQVLETAAPTTRAPTTQAPTTEPTTTQAPVTSPTPAPSPDTGSGVWRLTNGTGGKTEMDNRSPAGAAEQHGTRVYCTVSHFSHDDPIVFPNQPGRAHAHMFWGNTGTDAASTGADLLSSGNSTCEGGTNNRSAYWTPALHNQAGEVVVPNSIFVYYKSFGRPGFDRSTLRAIPPGLQMLANQDVPGSGPWHFKVNGGSNTVNLQLSFPECVRVDDGGSPVLSSGDNVSHLAYPNGDTGPSQCPTSHPYRIPQVILVLGYDGVPFSSDWSLSSDHHGQEKGSSLHADYIAAWDANSMDVLVECVVVERRSCGFSGNRGQLPERFDNVDGERIYIDSIRLQADADRTPFGNQIPKYAN